MTPPPRSSKPIAPGVAQHARERGRQSGRYPSAYGGIVPELASRNHVVTIMPVDRARAGARPAALSRDIDGIAVTRGPGLVGSLLVGLMCAKGLAQATGMPFVGVNHIEGHLLAPLLETRNRDAVSRAGGFRRPYRAVRGRGFRPLSPARHTRDDAAGEAFDKVAKLMGLGYPGGKIIDEIVAARKSQSGENSAREGAKARRSISASAASRPRSRISCAARPGARDLAARISRRASRKRWSICWFGRPSRPPCDGRRHDRAHRRRRRQFAPARTPGRGAGGREPARGRAVASILHRQRRDDRDGGKLSSAARRTRSVSRSTPKRIWRSESVRSAAEIALRTQRAARPRARAFSPARAAAVANQAGRISSSKRAIADRIVAAADSTADDVIEIGPGLGILTERILRSATRAA